MNQDSVNKSILVLIVISISALFFSMISQFLMAIFMAGLFSALARPVYRRLRIWFGGRRHLASAITMLLMIVVVLIPAMLLVGIVVGQAIDVGQSVTPWVKQYIDQPDRITLNNILISPTGLLPICSTCHFMSSWYPTAKSSLKKRGNWLDQSAN
jgi:predicted PurR-regulated permease PerM